MRLGAALFLAAFAGSLVGCASQPGAPAKAQELAPLPEHAYVFVRYVSEGGQRYAVFKKSEDLAGQEFWFNKAECAQAARAYETLGWESDAFQGALKGWK